MRHKTRIVAALWLSLGAVTEGETLLPDASVPGELKQKAAELDQAVEAAKEAVLKEYFNATAVLNQTQRTLAKMQGWLRGNVSLVEGWLEGNVSVAEGWLEGNLSTLKGEHAAELDATKETMWLASMNERKLIKDQQAEMAVATEVLLKGLLRDGGITTLPEVCEPCTPKWWQKLLRKQCKPVCRPLPIDVTKLFSYADATLCGYYDDRVHINSMDLAYKTFLQDMALFSGLAKAPIRQWSDFKNLLDVLTERLHERWVANVKLPPAGRWMYPVTLLLTAIYFFFVSLGLCAGARVARRAKKDVVKAVADADKKVEEGLADAKKKMDEAKRQTAEKLAEMAQKVANAEQQTAQKVAEAERQTALTVAAAEKRILDAISKIQVAAPTVESAKQQVEIIVKHVTDVISKPNPDVNDPKFQQGVKILKKVGHKYVKPHCWSESDPAIWGGRPGQKDFRNGGTCQICGSSVVTENHGLQCCNGGHHACWHCMAKDVDWKRALAEDPSLFIQQQKSVINSNLA